MKIALGSISENELRLFKSIGIHVHLTGPWGENALPETYDHIERYLGQYYLNLVENRGPDSHLTLSRVKGLDNTEHYEVKLGKQTIIIGKQFISLPTPQYKTFLFQYRKSYVPHPSVITITHDEKAFEAEIAENYEKRVRDAFYQLNWCITSGRNKGYADYMPTYIGRLQRVHDENPAQFSRIVEANAQDTNNECNFENLSRQYLGWSNRDLQNLYESSRGRYFNGLGSAIASLLPRN